MFKAPFSFEGRIRRIEYFLSALLASAIGTVIWVLAFASMFAGVATGTTGGAAGGSLFAILLGIVGGVAAVWFSLAQGVKRLHDLDKSGWLLLLCCVPIVGWIFSLYMLFADGTVGPNQYGPDPKNRQPYQAPAPVNVTVNISKDKDEVKVEQTSATETTPEVQA